MLNQSIFTKSPWIFLRGATEISIFPEEGPPEVAFSGCSNVGKSSLINNLLNRKNLARTSKSPGRTQEINFFIPDGYSGRIDDLPPIALVDMPGYGHAKAPKKNISAWGNVVARYLHERSTLKRLYLLIDCRHGIKKTDADVFSILNKDAISYQIILTKIDKIKKQMLQDVIDKTKHVLRSHPAAHPDIIATSSKCGEGIYKLRKAILEAINC
ncbi:ribosome biogenesis GTP-binding protein YihA/YsxC [Candidatus Liberibacter americanus]|uniref:Probable GTP-binding protein EngB n=1 Tax=Candidatus Liberibacter americanus str. Sao Paulo TaxID=1261131 RepID=U6B4D3_9HYPH|nr:ribosome biogenesis GTP-binding protein YihA/YsxC [Candidatus Liberibacter americanus]AHA27493.1 putative GTPase [Candidatus Liberibacter americanus str. Sao Paulo]EMS36545.1 GTPase EngB [Candidatus Liberibacter americanus PW_SP]